MAATTIDSVPDRTARSLTLTAVRTAMVIALAGALWLLSTIGLADNGDFARSIGSFSSGPAGASPGWPEAGTEAWHLRFFSYFIPDWQLDWSWKVPGSTAVFAWLPGILVSAVAHPGGELALPWVSLPLRLLFVAVLIAVFRWIDRTDGHVSPALTLTLGLPLVLLFSSPGYVAYLNSFYQESATFAFILLLLWSMASLEADPTSTKRTLVCVVSIALLTLSQASAFYWPLIAVPWLFHVRRPLADRAAWSRAGLVAVVTLGPLLAAGSLALTGAPGVNRYHGLFYGALTFSARPEQHIEALGADPGARDCIGVSAFDSDGARCVATVSSSVSYLNTAFVFLREPAALARTVAHGTVSMQDTSLDYLGRYAVGDPRAVAEPSARAYDGAEERLWLADPRDPHDLWGALKFHFFPRGAPLIGVLLLCVIWFARSLGSSGLRRSLSLMGLATATACMAEVLIAVLGDGRYELIKHLAEANFLFDLTAIAFLNTIVLAVLHRRATLLG